MTTIRLALAVLICLLASLSVGTVPGCAGGDVDQQKVTNISIAVGLIALDVRNVIERSDVDGDGDRDTDDEARSFAVVAGSEQELRSILDSMIVIEPRGG